MGKRCGNCANGTWTKGKDAVPEVCLECEYVHGEPSNWKEKNMTNADRIRAMSDEELAKFLAIPCECAVEPTTDGYRECGNKLCSQYLLKWLKQPAEVE